jgi:ApaG protein
MVQTEYGNPTVAVMSPKFPVQVAAHPEFLGRHEDKYAFSYTIYITNRSDHKITLRNRHWIITHADGAVEEVIGEGVIGQTPELAPGGSYNYTSGALIPTRVGSMRGSYGFVTADGCAFRAEIPEFTLCVPDALH